MSPSSVFETPTNLVATKKLALDEADFALRDFQNKHFRHNENMDIVCVSDLSREQVYSRIFELKRARDTAATAFQSALKHFAGAKE